MHCLCLIFRFVTAVTSVSVLLTSMQLKTTITMHCLQCKDDIIISTQIFVRPWATAVPLSAFYRLSRTFMAHFK